MDDVEYRAIVYSSDALDKRRLKKLERDLRESEMDFKEKVRSVPLRYACEADAKQAASLKSHTIRWK